MWALTGFADEVSHDFAEQLDLMQKLGIKHIEMRSAWGTKVLDLTPDQRKQAKQMLDDAGIKLSAVGSDLGKIQIGDPFEAHLERSHVARVTEGVSVKWQPTEEDLERCRDLGRTVADAVLA